MLMAPRKLLLSVEFGSALILHEEEQGYKA